MDNLDTEYLAIAEKLRAKHRPIDEWLTREEGRCETKLGYSKKLSRKAASLNLVFERKLISAKEKGKLEEVSLLTRTRQRAEAALAEEDRIEKIGTKANNPNIELTDEDAAIAARVAQSFSSISTADEDDSKKQNGGGDGFIGVKAFDRKERYTKNAEDAGLFLSSYIRYLLDQDCGLEEDPEHPYKRIPTSKAESAAIREAKVALSKSASFFNNWVPFVGSRLTRKGGFNMNPEENLWTVLQAHCSEYSPTAQKYAITIGSAKQYKDKTDPELTRAVLTAANNLNACSNSVKFALIEARTYSSITDEVLEGWISKMTACINARDILYKAALMLIP